MSGEFPTPGRLARFLVGLYPPSWRERYGEEYLALVADTGVRPRGVPDALRGAADAWLRPAGHVLPVSWRLRATVSVVWWAWIALAAGALIFGQSTEDAPFRVLDSAHPWLGAIYQTYVTAAHVSVLVVSVGAIPLVWSLGRQALRARQPRKLTLLAMPLLASVGFLLVLVAISRLVHHSSTPGVGIGPSWFLVLVLLGLAAAVACAAGPTIVLRQLEPPPRALRFAVLVTVPGIVTMGLAAIATTVYATALPHANAQLSPVVSDSSFLVPYGIVMALACVVAATSSARGLRALRDRPADVRT